MTAVSAVVALKIVFNPTTMSNLAKLNDIILDGFGQTAGEGFDFCDLLGEPIQTRWGLWSATMINQSTVCIRIVLTCGIVVELLFKGWGDHYDVCARVNDHPLKLEGGVEQGIMDTFLEFTNTSNETMANSKPQLSEGLASFMVINHYQVVID